MLLIFFLLLPFLLHSATATHILCSTSAAAAKTTTLSIFHINSKCTPFSSSPSSSTTTNLLDSVLRMAAADAARLAAIAAPKPSSIPVASALHVTSSGNYVARVRLGTPGQQFYMVLDTSSPITWLPCSGCTGCPTSSAAYFSPNRSLTFHPQDCRSPLCPTITESSCFPAAAASAAGGASVCMFNQTYADATFAAALTKDTLHLAADDVAGYTFGCMRSAAGGPSSLPPQGLLGLGRGPLSLLSQTSKLYKGTFSYCLPSFRSFFFSGSLRLGPVGQPRATAFTRLLTNSHRPSLYYVNLTAISVGKQVVATAPGLLPAFDPATGAGTVVDSGTVITRFVAPVYAAISKEFQKQVGGPVTTLGAFDTCFATAPAVPPNVTLHFEGMDVVLSGENVMIHSSAGTIGCLAMAAAPANVNSVVNVIANLQQQNQRVVFDVANSRLSFVRELCT